MTSDYNHWYYCTTCDEAFKISGTFRYHRTKACKTIGLYRGMADAEAALAECEQQARKPMLALESLTPGGSEYIGDVERCVTTIREKQTRQHKMIVKFKKERDDLERKLAEHPRIIAGRYCCCCGKVVVTEAGEQKEKQ